MRAAILTAQHVPLTVDTVSLPPVLDTGQVLVKVLYSGICGSQLGEIDGVKGEDPYLPHLLGHEGSGKVLQTGPGTRSVEEGDKVVLHWKKGKGIEAPTPVYTWSGKPLNAGSITTFNEYAVVSENRLTVIPDDFDIKTAALFGCAVTTGFGVISNNAQLKLGDSIAVIGTGGVGLSIVQGAALTSAYPIIAVDLYDKKLELAEKYGATHLINSSKKNIEEEIRNILGTEGLDVTVENTGSPDLIALSYELTKPQGKTILVGVPKVGSNISIYSLPLHFGKTITGSHGGESNPTEDIPKYIRLCQAGKLDLSRMISDTFTLDEINEAIQKIRSGEIAGRCLIKME